MTSSPRGWRRDTDEESGSWDHRFYRSDDGWTLEREYSPGDRALNRPHVSWELRRAGVTGFGSFDFDTMREAMAFCDSPLAALYIEWTLGRMNVAEYEMRRDALRAMK